MKITRPLFADRATGPIFGLGYFSGPEGNTRFTGTPLAPTRARGAPAHIRARFRAALARWWTRPYATTTLWRDFAALQLSVSPNVSQVFTSTRQQTRAGVLSFDLRRQLHEPN
jgi:hypothetical protein